MLHKGFLKSRNRFAFFNMTKRPKEYGREHLNQCLSTPPPYLTVTKLGNQYKLFIFHSKRYKTAFGYAEPKIEKKKKEKCPK